LNGILSRALHCEGAIGFGFVVTRLRLHGNFERRTRGFRRLCRKRVMRSLNVEETIWAPSLIFELQMWNRELEQKPKSKYTLWAELKDPKRGSGFEL
jgi:hypothetical protein